MLIKVIICLSLCIIAESKECSETSLHIKEKVKQSYEAFVRVKNRIADFFTKSVSKITSSVQTHVFDAICKCRNLVRDLFKGADKNDSDTVKLIEYRANDFGERDYRRTENRTREDKNDYQKSAVQMILHDGYRAEAHSVLTRDGYVLALHRVLPSTNSQRNNVVILHHGLMGSSDDWLLLGPSQALPYLLTEAGYDVWLVNSRGNKYSRLHQSYSQDNTSEYWNFSFHEIGTEDLPAVIDYIVEESTADSQINFVGFSLGATSLLVLISSLPRYNQVLKSATLLAPLAFMNHIEGPLKQLARCYKENASNVINFLGENELTPIDSFPRRFVEKFCSGDDRLCLNPLLLIANGGKEIEDENILRSLLGHLPHGASLKTLLHYLQLVNSGEFCMYDYGAPKNFLKYGDMVPPAYNLANVALPVILFHSHSDWLSTKVSISKLMTTLPEVIYHEIKDPDFSHTDFIWGVEAPIMVYEVLMESLNKVTQRHRIFRSTHRHRKHQINN